MIAALASTFVAEPLGAETLFKIGPLNFTNTMLSGLIWAVIVIAIFGAAAMATKTWPKSRFAFYIESLVDVIMGLLEESFGSRERAMIHFPLLITLFIFILFGNLSGLLPGFQTITATVNGEHISLFRSWTTDLNSTLAMAVFSLLTVHIYAVKDIGVKGYAKHFFSGNLLNPMTWFIGLNELFGEILRLVTLSLRLFGVIYGGEALLFAIAALAGNFGWLATLPVMFLEIFVSLVQAYLFMMLTTSYIVMSTTHGEGEESHSAQPAVAGGS